MIYNLLWLEWFKLRRRLSTWAIYTIFLALTALTFGGHFYSARGHGGPYWGLPEAWPDILTGGASIASTFGAVLVALTVSSEFEWRTSRQNIIDGLSRKEWFLSKLLLVPTVSVGLYGTQIILGAALALLDTQSAHKHLYHPAFTYVVAGFGAWLGLCCYSFIALLVSIWLRSAGPAVGLTVIYQVFDTIAARTLRGFHLDRIAAWLPMQVHAALMQFNQYFPQPDPSLEYHGTTYGVLFAIIGWTAVLCAASRWVFLERDL